MYGGSSSGPPDTLAFLSLRLPGRGGGSPRLPARSLRCSAVCGRMVAPCTGAHYTAHRCGDWRRRRSRQPKSRPQASRPPATPPPQQWWADDPSLEQRVPALLREGRVKDAQQLICTRADPRHAVSRFYLGVCTGMLEGEAAAVEHYEAAIAEMPGMTVAYTNLIRALLARRGSGDQERALELALEDSAARPAVAEPRYNVGVILMQLGRTAQAATAFEETLQIDPTHHGALINGAHTLTALYAEAHRSAAELNRRIEALGRLGVAAGVWENPYQRPPCFIRNLRPSRPWHDPATFEIVHILEAAYPAIRDELLAAQKIGRCGRGDTFTPVGGRAVHDHTIVAVGEWRELPLYGNGSRHEANCALCPRTAAAVARCHLATDLALAGGGETLFSVVRGGTHLRPHCGSTNARLTCHLGIVIPQGCEIRAGKETRT